MNRNLLMIGIVGIAVVAIGATAYWVVLYYQRAPLGGGGWFAARPPLTVEQVIALQEKGEDAAPEIPKLIACFAFNDEDLRLNAAIALGMIGGKAVGPVREKLKDENAKARYYALQTLTFLGPQAKGAADEVTARLGDADADVRYKAAFTLGKLGVASDAVVAALVGGLNDDDGTVAQAAGEALEALRPDSSSALYRLLANQDDPRRVRYIRLLVKKTPAEGNPQSLVFVFDAPTKAALPTLTQLVKDDDKETRGHAMTLLGRAGAEAAPTFKELLKEANPDDYTDLAYGLAALGADAKGLLPELSAYLAKRPHWDAVPESMVPFKKCGLDGAKALGEVLEQVIAQKKQLKDDRIRIAVTTLGEMGADAKPAVKVLAVVLQRYEPLRPQTLQALGNIGPAANEAVPAVQALLKTSHAREARDALRRMGVLK